MSHLRGFEGLKKKRLTVIGLKHTGLGSLHLVADTMYTGRIHGVMCERAFLSKVHSASLSNAFSTTSVSHAVSVHAYGGDSEHAWFWRTV